MIGGVVVIEWVVVSEVVVVTVAKVAIVSTVVVIVAKVAIVLRVAVNDAMKNFFGTEKCRRPSIGASVGQSL